MQELLLSVKSWEMVLAAIAVSLTGGTVRVYSGERPSSPELEADASALLVAFGLRSFRSPVGGVMQSGPIEPARVVKSGRPAWFRASDASGLTLLDGSIGKGGQMMLDRRDVELGGTVVIEEWAFAAPGATS